MLLPMAKHMKPINLGAKREALEQRYRANADLHKRMKAETMERWKPETVCIRAGCMRKRHAKGYCERHYKQERKRERIQPR